jgi:hypothetical protein
MLIRKIYIYTVFFFLLVLLLILFTTFSTFPQILLILLINYSLGSFRVVSESRNFLSDLETAENIGQVGRP